MKRNPSMITVAAVHSGGGTAPTPPPTPTPTIEAHNRSAGNTPRLTRPNASTEERQQHTLASRAQASQRTASFGQARINSSQ